MFQRRTQSQPGSRGSSFRGGGIPGGTPRTGERGEQQPGGQRTTSPPPPSYLFQVLVYKESHENTHLRLPFGSYQDNFPVFFLVTASTTASIVVSQVRTGSVIMTSKYARVETPQHPQPSHRPLATDRPHPASESGTNIFPILQCISSFANALDFS